jgi:Tfp pilus assembly protein PilO
MSSLPPLWRRQLLLLAAAVLFAGGNLAFFLFYRSGWQMRRESLEARRVDLQHAAEAKEVEAEKLTAQRDRLSGVSSAIDEFYGHRIGPERETLATIVAELHGVLRDVGVTVPSISYNTSNVAKLPLTQMKINFSVRCDYPRFKRLLRAFETDKRWIAVQSVSIARDADPGAVTVQLELATYFAEPAAAAAGQAIEASAAGAASRRAG